MAVGLEHVAAPGLLRLPGLQSVGQAVWMLDQLTVAAATAPWSRQPAGARDAFYLALWQSRLASRAEYAGRAGCARALQHVGSLVGLLPADWTAFVRTGLHLLAALTATAAAPSPLPPPPVAAVTAASVASARRLLCGGLGWRLPRPGGGEQLVIRLDALTVALATRLQRLAAHDAIAPRHAACLARVRALDGLPPGAQLPAVPSVLARWWRVRVANTYKEAAWRLPLDAFPTAARMQRALPANQQSTCVACSHVGPDVSHHFWLCPVAEAVRHEVEAQLVGHGWRQQPSVRPPCSSLWLGRPPDPRLHPLVWDFVCLAAVHAMERGRRVAWAVAERLGAPHLVEHVATRAARRAFWEALADFAATTTVPRTSRTSTLLQQPFVAWRSPLRGNGLCVVRYP
jgi:hypothetical protein